MFDSNGDVTGNSIGQTTAKVWMENTLGDRVETEYNINVVNPATSLIVTKNLNEKAEEPETFYFMISGDDGSFYTKVTVPANATTASVTIDNVVPGVYTVTELESNWRYELTTANSIEVDCTGTNTPGQANFTNRRNSDRWISDHAAVTNKMTDNI